MLAVNICIYDCQQYGGAVVKINLPDPTRVVQTELEKPRVDSIQGFYRSERLEQRRTDNNRWGT
jgi:hypothetical protein